MRDRSLVRRPVLALLLAAAFAACDSSVTPPPSPSTVAVAESGAPGSRPPGSSAAPASPGAKPTPAATPKRTAAPKPTPAPTPVPWQSYTSKLNHYAMKYPPEWIVTPGSAKLADRFDAYTYPYVYVNRDLVSRNVSIGLTVSDVIAATKSRYKAKLVSNKPIKLAGGYAGRILTFSGTDAGFKVTIQKVVAAKGKVAYFLDLVADARTAPADMALFRKIYGTWRPK